MPKCTELYHLLIHWKALGVAVCCLGLTTWWADGCTDVHPVDASAFQLLFPESHMLVCHSKLATQYSPCHAAELNVKGYRQWFHSAWSSFIHQLLHLYLTSVTFKRYFPCRNLWVVSITSPNAIKNWHIFSLCLTFSNKLTLFSSVFLYASFTLFSFKAEI